jgi:DNA-binding transcriptional MerR regulator
MAPLILFSLSFGFGSNGAKFSGQNVTNVLVFSTESICRNELMSTSEKKNDHLSIQFVSNITGINSHTIRAWEKRYKAIEPIRDKNGRRVYSQDHIHRLSKLFKLISMGNKISDVAKLLDDELTDLIKKYSKDHPSQKQDIYPDENTTINTQPVLTNLLLALSLFKLDVISHEIHKMKMILNPRDFAFNILLPLLHTVSEKVENGSLSIAQEHALSAILKFHASHLLYRPQVQSKTSPIKIAITSPEGEVHEFGIMIAALLCLHYKLQFYYFSISMPASALAEACNQIDASIIILGISKGFQTTAKNSLHKYLEELTLKLSDKTKIWIGGVHASAVKHVSNAECIPTLEILDHNLASL